MIPLTHAMTLTLIITGGITVFAMLGVFANVIGHQTQLHDLRNAVQDLQYQRALFDARMNGQIAPESKPQPTPEAAANPAPDAPSELPESQPDSNANPEPELSATGQNDQPEPAQAIAA
ncbi:MAG: hypothetical protein ACWA5W_01550 [Phycisphaerales bacterium]